MEYVKLPDVVDAVQLTGLSECGCTPAFDNEGIPKWLYSLLTSKQLRGFAGRPDASDPLGSLPRFGLTDLPDRSIGVGGWVIRKHVRGSMCAYDTMSDEQFRATYAPKLPGSILGSPVLTADIDPIGTQADVDDGLAAVIASASASAAQARSTRSDILRGQLRTEVAEILNVQHPSEISLADIKRARELVLCIPL